MRLALTLGALATANLGVGAIQQWYVVLLVGPGVQTDALFAATAVPTLILSVINGPFTYILIPLLASKASEESWRDARLFFALVGCIFLVLCCTLWISTPLWFPATVPGLPEPGKALGVDLARIQLIGIFFIALHGVLWSALHAQQQFVVADASPVVAASLGLALLVWVLPRYGVVGAAWVSVARYAIQMGILVPRLGRFGRTDWDGPALREAWRRLKPLLLGTAYYKADPLIDRFLSSMTPPGGLSLLYLGQQLIVSAAQVVNSAVAAPMIPQLAGRARSADWYSFRRIYRGRLVWATLIALLGYLLFVTLGLPGLQLVGSRGSVTDESVRLLWTIMLCLVGVLVGGIYGQILSTAFYTLGNTRTPTILGSIGVTIGIVLKVFGFFELGLLGIAISTSAYYLLNAVVIYVFLERYLSKLVKSEKPVDI